MTYSRRCSPLGLVVMTFFLAGCGSEPELHPVRGQLIKKMGEIEFGGFFAQPNGKPSIRLLAEPVPSATMAFVPETPGALAAQAMADPRGFFTLETPSWGQGAVKGRYKVVVDTPHSEKRLNDRYSAPETTTLEIEVVEGGLEFKYLILED